MRSSTPVSPGAPGSVGHQPKSGPPKRRTIEGRFDDESRCYSVIITVSRDSARMTVIRRESGPSWSRELGAAAKDAAWIADLLAHGLIEGSFVPPAPIQELRDLTRTRKQLVAEIARHTQRPQKTLEDANVKLTRVVSDILGTSGRAILAALIAGETDPERLADCTTGRLKAGRADIVAAVHGRVTAHRSTR